MALLTMVQALNQALDQEMAANPNVVIMGEDVGHDGGVFRVTDGLIQKYGEKRVLDTPLAEAGIVGTALGMSVYGLRPVVEIQFFGFTYPAFQEIVSHVARLRTRTRGVYTCPMVIRTPYGIGIKALEHHSESTEAYFTHTPGIKVVVPSSPYDAKGLLISAMRSEDPVLFLEPSRLYRSIKQEVPETVYEIPLGKAKILKQGTDLTIVAWGSMLRMVMQTLSKDQNLSAEVIDLRTLSPLDWDTIFTSVEKTRRLLIVAEAPRLGGLASDISATVSEKFHGKLKAPVERVTGFDITPPLPLGEHLYMVDEKRILKAIKKLTHSS
ncbi:alpha-ketoacid dehydrogenase subunit beta [Patescibacteria group bacterium]|nr:alpha-ketoacid dehydrogenase subunit beta [Patescibacteria group bacterium]